MDFTRQTPRKAVKYVIEDIHTALTILRKQFPEIQFSESKGNLIVSLSGSHIHDALVNNRIMELGGVPI